MKSTSPYANSFEYDKKYSEAKTKLSIDKYNGNNERQFKESFKCTLGKDCRVLTDSLRSPIRITEIPDYLYASIAQAESDPKYREIIQCIMLYFEDKSIWTEYCSVIKSFPGKTERIIKKYYNSIRKDTKKELNDLSSILQKDQAKRYRFAVFFFFLIIKNFYFSTLPKHVPADIYKSCPTLQQFYENDPDDDNSYIRISSKEKIRNALPEEEAWRIIFHKLSRHGLCK